jgi:hypothetical protein
VLRQLVDLEPGPALTAGAGLTGGRRVLACALISDPASTPRTVVASPVAVAQRVDDDTLLVSVLDDDAARARPAGSVTSAPGPAPEDFRKARKSFGRAPVPGLR